MTEQELRHLLSRCIRIRKHEVIRGDPDRDALFVVPLELVDRWERETLCSDSPEQEKQPSYYDEPMATYPPMPKEV